MESEEIRKKLIKGIGVPEEDVLLEFDHDYPECLMVVVLQDVGPHRIHEGLRKLSKTGIKRAVINIVEKKYATMLRAVQEKSCTHEAIRKSWDVNVATVRWE